MEEKKNSIRVAIIGASGVAIGATITGLFNLAIGRNSVATAIAPLQAQIETLRNEIAEQTELNEALAAENVSLLNVTPIPVQSSSTPTPSAVAITPTLEPTPMPTPKPPAQTDLFSLTPFTGEGSVRTVSADKDIYGNPAQGYIVRGGSRGNRYFVYELNSQYKKLAGSLMLTGKNKSSEYSYWLEFYGDDVLIGKSPIITGGSKLETFEFDISNVTDLKIVFINDYTSPVSSDKQLFNVQGITIE